eukprot:TRINITY_DN19447_c0_g2_i1.p1 TRINITY_DN19447_c0_g2~~TRINITY_DN19447_c0_g2_i1.p1  ORF type:complete len:1680 (+),score=136.73 TRINITY_DN19447_c0_g2_i1:79-5118(+)
MSVQYYAPGPDQWRLSPLRGKRTAALAVIAALFARAAAQVDFDNCKTPSNAFVYEGRDQDGPCPSGTGAPALTFHLATVPADNGKVLAACNTYATLCDGDGALGANPPTKVTCRNIGTLGCDIPTLNPNNYWLYDAAFSPDFSAVYAACGDRVTRCDFNSNAATPATNCARVTGAKCPKRGFPCVLNCEGDERGVLIPPSDGTALVISCHELTNIGDDSGLLRCPLSAAGAGTLAGACTWYNTRPCSVSTYFSISLDAISKLTVTCSSEYQYCTFDPAAGPSGCSSSSIPGGNVPCGAVLDFRGAAQLTSGMTAVSCSTKPYMVCGIANPTVSPTYSPSTTPTVPPSFSPTVSPTTAAPTTSPTASPSAQPTVPPTVAPTTQPSDSPSAYPTKPPTAAPTPGPSMSPSGPPTAPPTTTPTTGPTAAPTSSPWLPPTVAPSSAPSPAPTQTPTAPPAAPTLTPTAPPAPAPSGVPSPQPTSSPRDPTSAPSERPAAPSSPPTLSPSPPAAPSPSKVPSSAPSASPSLQLGPVPSRIPSASPSSGPMSPTASPSQSPVPPPGAPTQSPVAPPTKSPSVSPTTPPSISPFLPPSTPPSGPPSRPPLRPPSAAPTGAPRGTPSQSPSEAPSGPAGPPSGQPTAAPSAQPAAPPTVRPSLQPTLSPGSRPSVSPTSAPSAPPATVPSALPTAAPSMPPSARPTAAPGPQPSAQPSAPPGPPSAQPTSAPSARPSSAPTVQPTAAPIVRPTAAPGARPSVQPSTQPTSSPGLPGPTPSAQPSPAAGVGPSAGPTVPPAAPSAQPSAPRTDAPVAPSATPSAYPVGGPSASPALPPTRPPSAEPSALPAPNPTATPRAPAPPLPAAPSAPPAPAGPPPSSLPRTRPTRAPPTGVPAPLPTVPPTMSPSRAPSNPAPTMSPSEAPSVSPIERSTAPPAPRQQRTLHPGPQTPGGVPTAAPSRRSAPGAVPTRSPSPTAGGATAPPTAPGAVSTAHPTTGGNRSSALPPPSPGGGGGVSPVLDAVAGGIAIISSGGPAIGPLIMVADTSCTPEGPIQNPPRSLCPTGLEIADNIYLGCLVGNCIIALGVAALNLALMACFSRAKRTEGRTITKADLQGSWLKRLPQAAHNQMEDLEVAAIVRFPNTVLIVAFLLYQGAAFSAFRLLVTPQEAWVRVIGGAGAAALLCAPLRLVAHVRRGVRALPHSDCPERGPHPLARIRPWDPPAPPQWLQRVPLSELGDWVSCRKQRHWVLMWQAAVRHFRVPAADTGVLTELLMMWALGLTNAFATPSWAACGHQRLAGAVVHLATLVYIWCRRPYRCFSDSVLRVALLAALAIALCATATAYYGVSEEYDGITWQELEQKPPPEADLSGAEAFIYIATGLALLQSLLRIAANVILFKMGWRAQLQRNEWAEGDARMEDSLNQGLIELQSVTLSNSAPPNSHLSNSLANTFADGTAICQLLRSPTASLSTPSPTRSPSGRRRPRRTSARVPSPTERREYSEPETSSLPAIILSPDAAAGGSVSACDSSSKMSRTMGHAGSRSSFSPLHMGSRSLAERPQRLGTMDAQQQDGMMPQRSESGLQSMRSLRSVRSARGDRRRFPPRDGRGQPPARKIQQRHLTADAREFDALAQLALTDPLSGPQPSAAAPSASSGRSPSSPRRRRVTVHTAAAAHRGKLSDTLQSLV